MSLAKAVRSAERTEDKDTREKLPFEETVEVLDTIRASTAGVRRIPSSIMLQVLFYGDTFKRVVSKVEVNRGEFEKKYESLVDRLSKGGWVVSPSFRHSYYDRFWEDIKTESPSTVRERVNSILEPLNSIHPTEFQLRYTPKFNWKYSEAIETYVFQERMEGVSFFNSSNRTLTLYFKVRGSQPRMTVSDVMVDYYVLIRLEGTPDGGINVVYGCTCPHARGETKDSRGNNIPPAVTGMCKHVIAGLFYFFPNIFAFIESARKGLTEKAYEEELQRISERYEAFKSRLDDVIKSLMGDVSKPSNEETPSRAILSNVVYLMYKGFWGRLQTMINDSSLLLRSVKKLVPPVSMLYEFESLWRTLSPKVVEVSEEEAAPQQTKPLREVLTHSIAKIEKMGVYERLNQVRSLLNGLQGSVEDTPYTRSLTVSLILGSNLFTDPIVVSSCGDPGTGKTLTVLGLGELVGFNSLVVEREVSAEDVLNEAKRMVAKRVERYASFFEKVILPKVPKEKSEEASEFFRKFVEEIVSSVTADEIKDLAAVSKRMAESFASLYGVESRKAVLALARLYLSLMKLSRKVFLEYSSGKALERKVIEERRAMLSKLQELGLISSADEKEKFNSGSVRWDVQQTSLGYRILVYVDLHYLLSRFKGDRAKIERVVEELSNLGSLKYVREKGGVAEVKLSEAAYLEKAFKTREEDIGGKLIWVGGELTRKGVMLIDESRRAPDILEAGLTELSKAARDSRRTNVVVTTDNAEPLMETESDPRLDAFLSRTNFQVTTPSSTVEATIEESLRRINELDVSGRLPLVTYDELYALNVLADHVEVPERYIQIAYSIPLLMIYDFRVLRPEVASAIPREKAQSAPPLVMIVPKGSFEASNVKGDYEASTLGPDVPAVRRMPERRFGHHVMRAMKTLAIVEKKVSVDEEAFLSAISMVLPSRVVPLDVQEPYRYLDYKQRYVEAVVSKVRDVLSQKQTATEKLIEVMGSLSEVPQKLLADALEEMSDNPVLAALFCRFLEQMLVSKKSREFVEYSKAVPGLRATLDLLARYEKLPVKL